MLLRLRRKHHYKVITKLQGNERTVIKNQSSKHGYKVTKTGKQKRTPRQLSAGHGIVVFNVPLDTL